MLGDSQPFHSYLPGAPKGVKLFAHVAVLPHLELNTNRYGPKGIILRPYRVWENPSMYLPTVLPSVRLSACPHRARTLPPMSLCANVLPPLFVSPLSNVSLCANALRALFVSSPPSVM